MYNAAVVKRQNTAKTHAFPEAFSRVSGRLDLGLKPVQNTIFEYHFQEFDLLFRKKIPPGTF